MCTVVKSMKKIAFVLTSIALAAAASAQSFTIGPRVSSYSTDIDGGISTMKTGRQSSYGLAGDFRSGVFVLDYSYDHDPENGIDVTDFLVDTGDYTRDRGEVTVGFAALPFLDLQGGVRIESFRVGGFALIGNPIATDMDVNHNALAFGVKLHSTSMRPFGVYGLARGYVGTAKINRLGVHNDSDTSGYRFEGGFAFPIGESSWSVQPGVEYEHIETKDFGIRLNTNRFILGFVYTSGRR